MAEGAVKAGGVTTKAEKPKSLEIVGDDPNDRKGELKRAGGSMSDSWNNVLVRQVGSALWFDADPKIQHQQIMAAVAGVMEIGPKDEIEGMLASQMIAAHNAAMECYRRAMIPQQTIEGREQNLTQANKLSRTHVTLVEALNRHRGKGQQKVTVEHVHVYKGGQAIVGAVTPGGGVTIGIEDQSHATTTATLLEPQPTLRGTDEGRDVLPVAGDAERPLPHARRESDRGSEGQPSRAEARAVHGRGDPTSARDRRARTRGEQAGGDGVG